MALQMQRGLWTARTNRRHLSIVCAKKGGKPQKGKSALDGLLKKKQEVEEAKVASHTLNPGERAAQAQWNDPEVRALLFNLVTSYHKATKKFLMEDVDLEQLPAAIYHAPFVCLAHDQFQEGVTDPRFIYANKAALDLWEANWDQLIGMPSRLSAAPSDAVQQDRQALLDKAASNPSGYVGNYEGWRISLNGNKFKILGVELFNIVDFSGTKMGQAAVFKQYETEDGKVVEVKATPWQAPQVEAVVMPSEEEIKEAEAQVEAWADYVRQLKAQGRGNKDPDVQSGVAELQMRKAYLEDLRKRVQDALAAAEAAFGPEDDE